MKATASSTTLKKKALKGAFYGPTGGSFSQKKKVVFGNIKHSGDERDIFLSKSGSSGSIYSDVESLSGKDEDVSMSGMNGGSLLEKSMEMTASLAREKGININSDLKKQEMRSDQAVVIKEILIDMPKNIIVTAVTKFGEIKSIKIQLIGMWQKAVLASKWSFLIRKDSVHVAKTVGDHDTWAFRDQFRALLFTLPVGTTVHNLGTLLNKAGGKTCTINQLLMTDNRVCCAVVGFESEVDLESTFYTVPVFGSVQLSWARLDLVWCGKYGRFGHSALECNASDVAVPVPAVPFKKNALGIDYLQLAKLYTKKNVPISRPTAFVVSLTFSSDSSSSGSGYGLGFSSSNVLGLGGGAPSFLFDESPLVAHLASLERFFELLADQVSGILRKLSFVELVPIVISSDAPSLVSSVLVAPVLDSNMALDGVLALSPPPLSSIKLSAGFNSSSSKVLTIKIDSLEFKMSAIEALVNSVLAKLDLFGLVWKFTTCNVRRINVPAKQEDVVCWHQNSGNLVSFITETKLRFSTRLWIANKFDEVFIGAGVAIIMDNSLACYVSKVEEVSGRVVFVQLLFKGKLLVTLLGLYAGASSETRFGQASEVNSLIAKAVNSSIHVVLSGDFNKNGSDRSVSFKFCLGLSLVIQLVLICGATQERFVKWAKFRDLSLAKLLSLGDVFFGAEAHSNVDAMWIILQKAVLGSADKTFSRHWFSKFRHSKNRHSFKFFGLELLMAKIVKKFCSGGLSDVNLLVSKWLTLDNVKACAFRDLVSSSVKSNVIVKHLLLVRKDYRRTKMFELRFFEEISIRKTIDRRMENFCSDKDSMIRSVLNRLFCKIVLDHLVVDNKLVLKSEEVKASYVLLSYVQNDVFSGIMHEVSMSKLLSVISGLPDGKTTGLSGILNELWKQGGEGDNFLVLKDMSTQSSVFAVSLVVEDALEKNQEIWLVLQNMWKTYDSVGWHYLRASL
ncbi:hypothetical protein G9A89_022314 [Geosiphon pyriformis]|nr:hypothetical protein G9A89_022314 [Geosiphon pyriformis]